MKRHLSVVDFANCTTHLKMHAFLNYFFYISSQQKYVNKMKFKEKNNNVILMKAG